MHLKNVASAAAQDEVSERESEEGNESVHEAWDKLNRRDTI